MSPLAEIFDQLRRGVEASALESTTLEFKQPDASLKRTLEILADSVVCLANADGGRIIVGVADRPGDRGSIVGVGSELRADVVVRGVFDRTEPALSVPVEELWEDGHRLLLITVPRGATLYANAKGTATRRVGVECRPFSPDQQRQAMAARGLHDWSAQSSGEPMSTASPAELDRLRSLLVDSGKDELAGADDRRLLRDLRLVLSTGELTRAGLLLVGREEAIRRAVPTYGYAYQYRPSPGSEARTHFREQRPLLTGIERMMDAVDVRRVVHPLNVRGGVQLQLHDYPTRAVRELIVNALVHRDYESEGEVEVEHSPQQFVVSSPGGLVFGVTPENILTHPSTPRNRLLLEVVTILQVAERTGQGVDRVYREMLRSGKTPPEYRDSSIRVDVTLPGGTGDDAFTRFVTAELLPESASDVDVLLALDILRSRKTLAADVLATRVQRSPGEAQGVLERMTEAGLVEPSRRSARRPFPVYSLTSETLAGMGRAVTYRRRSGEGVDHKVLEHIREYGYITNQTLRRLFDLDVYSARDLLRDLQTRGIVRKLDDKSSGPGIRYGAGPQVPLGKEPRKGG